ncbi:hypothetical protein NMG60_11019944 [Bertholletia excelsa]
MKWSAIGTPSSTPLTTPLTRIGNFAEKNQRLLHVVHNEIQSLLLQLGVGKNTGTCITMRDRSKNRKPLQKGRNLSVEAIQTIQALKRARNRNDEMYLERVFASSFKRLLKSDMMAVFRELLRQNECLLALKVFAEIQNEDWYKPQVSLYSETISVLGINGLHENIEQLFAEMKMKTSREHDADSFNKLLENLMNFNMAGLAMECYYLMKSLGCEPDKLSFRILISGLESRGEVGLASAVRQEAGKYYGKSLEFLEDGEELALSQKLLV